MATSCCGTCIWLMKRGGVYLCGCRNCPMYNKSVNINSLKSCSYYK